MGTQKNYLNETVLLSTQNMLTRESVTQALVLPPKMLVPKGLLIDISNNVNVMLLSKKLSTVDVLKFRTLKNNYFFRCS